jgi:carboxymethylenebutenolidase
MKVAFERYEKFDPAQGMLDIEDLIKDLKSRPQCNGKVGVLGFCFGGRYAHLATARLGVNAAAAFHGTMIGLHLDEVDKVTVPVSYSFGDQDPVVPMDEVAAIQKAFAGKKNADIRVFKGATHNFSMPRKDGYHPQAAKEAREAALKCFKSM